MYKIKNSTQSDKVAMLWCFFKIIYASFPHMYVTGVCRQTDKSDCMPYQNDKSD